MRSRIAFAVVAIAAIAATATACGPENSDPASTANAAPTTAAVSAPAAPSPATSATSARPTPSSTAPAPAGSAAAASGSGASGSGGTSGKTKECAAGDLTFSGKFESQAGGYLQITATAKPGVTCALPGIHPTIAFGSNGIEAANAEQAVGESITLSGSKVAYAGVNPKSTNNEEAIEFTEVIIAIGDTDPDPASLPVSSIQVDKPIVTNWHTSAKDAVPGV